MLDIKKFDKCWEFLLCYKAFLLVKKKRDSFLASKQCGGAKYINFLYLSQKYLYQFSGFDILKNIDISKIYRYIKKISIYRKNIDISKKYWYIEKYRYIEKNIDIVFQVSIYIEKISILFFRYWYISKKYRYCFSHFDIYRKNIDIDFQVSIYIEKISISKKISISITSLKLVTASHSTICMTSNTGEY